jgi:predicted nucleic acid-binding protein
VQALKTADFGIANLRIRQLMKTYRNIPMSLADACLVRMAEIHEHSKVMTLDSDFTVYRKSRRKVIPLLRPER